MALFRSTGTTPSEQYLARLCQRTFLSCWSYPNVFRNQGQKACGGEGKELCDLLVVFGNDVLIFSDKSCTFPYTGKLELDWCRWFKRSVQKSAGQVYGAERWIRQFPTRLYLDRQCTQPFPLPLGDPANIRVHRIVVALNVAERCRKELGGSGSLILAPKIVGQAHIDPKAPFFTPFAVGQIDPCRGFVHVFDDVTLDTVMQELDTASDFVSYLMQKEKFITEGHLHHAPGEEELLAVYLTHLDQSGRHGFDLPAGQSQMAIKQGSWASLGNAPEYLAKKQADRQSYRWDGIIEEFTKHAFGGTLILGSQTSIKDNERMYRIMAAESRFGRRVLANDFNGILRDTPTDEIGTRTVVSQDHRETIYVFVCMPLNLGRKHRGAYLTDCCTVAASKYREFKRVLGLATETGFGRERSYDAVLFEPSEWTEEMEADVRLIQQEKGIYTRTTQTRVYDEEYPTRVPVPMTTRTIQARKVGRNEPCPCGSGRKYKHCCL